MSIYITQEAADFFRKEINPAPGKAIRIYGKIYGSTNVHDNYSVGIAVEEPKNVAESGQRDNIEVFINKDDAWFLEDYNLRIDYTPGEDAPSYYFTHSDPKLAVDTSSSASINN